MAGTTTLTACSLCGGVAAPLTVHRAQAASFPSRLPRALLYPLSRGGLLTLAAVAAVVTALRWFGLLGAFLASGVSWAFFFSLIRTSARGSEELEVGDFGDPLSDVVVPALRGLLATALLWVPALLYLASRIDRESLANPAALAGLAADPVLWLILLASVLYAPMAIVMAAMGGGFLQMLNPVAGVAFMARLGRDYLVAVAAIVALGLGDLLAGLLGRLFAATGVPFVSAWGAAALGLYFPAVMSRVLGLLLHVRGDSLEVGLPQDYQDPVLPGVEPRGSPPAADAAAPGTAAPPEAPPTPAARPAPAAARVAPVASAAPAPAEPVLETVDLRAAIARAVEEEDLPRAVALYGASSLRASDLEPRVHFAVARGAAAARDYRLAVRALRAAASSPKDPVAPRALLVMSRIYARKLGDPATARRMLDHLLESYPESDAAREGRADLAAAG